MTDLKIDLEDRVRKLYKKAERDVTRTYKRIDWLKREIIKYAPYDPITAKIKRGIAAADARLIAYIGWQNEFYHLVDEIDEEYIAMEEEVMGKEEEFTEGEYDHEI